MLPRSAYRSRCVHNWTWWSVCMQALWTPPVQLWDLAPAFLAIVGGRGVMSCRRQNDSLPYEKMSPPSHNFKWTIALFHWSYQRPILAPLLEITEHTVLRACVRTILCSSAARLPFTMLVSWKPGRIFSPRRMCNKYNSTVNAGTCTRFMSVCKPW